MAAKKKKAESAADDEQIVVRLPADMTTQIYTRNARSQRLEAHVEMLVMTPVIAQSKNNTSEFSTTEDMVVDTHEFKAMADNPVLKVVDEGINSGSHMVSVTNTSNKAIYLNKHTLIGELSVWNKKLEEK